MTVSAISVQETDWRSSRVGVTTPDAAFSTEIEAPPDHLQIPLATYLGDVAGAIRVASNFDGKRKKGEKGGHVVEIARAR